MTNTRFDELFGGPPRRPDDPVTDRDCDLARSIQVVTEEIVLRIARHAAEVTGRAPPLPRPVASPSTASPTAASAARGPFDEIWIQPAAGDAGGALGAALWRGTGTRPKRPPARQPSDGMPCCALLGPAFSARRDRRRLDRAGPPLPRTDRRPALLAATAERLAHEKVVVGVFQGRMEFGPRALGNRSILGDPRSPRMQSVLNLKIKFRESFRPFAPAVLDRAAADYFDLAGESPYMLLVAAVEADDMVAAAGPLPGPAVAHVDGSSAADCRCQSLARAAPDPHGVPSGDRQSTCSPSFHVRGEPIGCVRPTRAYRA